MSTNDNRKNSHNMIDHIFQNLLPARGMTERPEQISLSHLMLDAMLDGSIALCDAGTGIGKTYSYLAAGAAFLCFQAANGLKFRPIVVSTSSIALQNTVQNEYLPLLSDVLMEDGLTDQTLQMFCPPADCSGPEPAHHPETALRTAQALHPQPIEKAVLRHGVVHREPL